MEICGHYHRKTVVAELGLEPAFPEPQFVPCSVEAAGFSPSQSQTSGPPALWLSGMGTGVWISQKRECLEARKRNQRWDSQDSGWCQGI